MAEVALEGVHKVYANDCHAVRDLCLTIEAGELLVLVGPSGCGKTTILRLVAGLEAPTRGIVRIAGQIVNRWPPWRRDVAMVFQRPALYPHRTVRDNLLSSRLLSQPSWLLRFLEPQRRERRMDSAAIRNTIAATAKLLELEGLLDRLPAELSGGEQQRVALGRALVRRPGLLLLDEPLSNLDAGLRLELRRELHLLHRRFPATMVYVTHDPVEALTLGDRVAVLNEGVLQQVDRPEALYQRPCNRFVAGFFGWPPMSFLDGRLVLVQGKAAFVATGWNVPLRLPEDSHGTWYDGRDLTLGVRPEDVTWHVEPADGRTPMEVELVEKFGNFVLVMLTADGQQLAGLATQGKGVPVKEGQKVMVQLRTDHIHLFDRASGRTLESS
jgi:multiple sugar transport system ATP-binding protein